MSRQIKFGDQVIDGIQTFRWSYGSRAVADVFARRHGGIGQARAFMNPRTVTFTGIASKASEALMDTYMDDLAERLVNLGQAALYKDAADSRYLNAIMTRFEGGEQSNAFIPTEEKNFLIEFLATDPFWYAVAESSDTAWVPVASPESNTVTNAGGLGTFPRFEITNTKGSDNTGTFILKHMTLDLQISWTGTISTGATLVIDCNEHTIVQGATDKISGFDQGSAFFGLILGDNEIRYTGDLDVSIDTYWTHRWGS